MAIITNLAMIGGLYSNPIVTLTGLLDTLTTQPASAYSTRKLRSGYAGPALRVRRSSDDTEQDIGFTANGNLDESSLVTFCGSASGYIRTWYDQKGTANLVQTTNSNQPRIVDAGAVVKSNSRPTVEALASGQHYMNAAYSNTGTQILIANVFSMRTATSSVGRLSSLGQDRERDDSSTGYIIGLARNNNTLNVNANRNGNFGGSLSAYNTLYTHQTGFSGTGGMLSINGTQVATSASTGNFNISLFRLFCNTNFIGDFWDGVCSEIILFNSYPNATDQSAIQASQKSYFTTP